MGPFADVLGPRAAEMAAASAFDLSVVSDDRPFFFSRFPVWRRVLHQLGLSRTPLGSLPLDLGGRTLLAAVVATGAATVALLLAPVIARRWTRRRRPAAGGTQARGRSGAAW